MKFVVTVDDAGLGQSAEVEQRSMEFFAAHDVPVSLFAIPCGRGGELASDPQWVSRARRHEAQGHDYQLHGYAHAGYEFGAPPWWMVQICGEKMRQAEAAGYPDDRGNWAREVLRDKFQQAIAAFERAFGRRPQVFRAGCLAAGDLAFEVMDEVGLLYDSNKVVDPRGWEYIAQKFDTTADWDPAVPPHPYYLNDRVIELPCASEYAWTLSEETLQHFIDLAMEDMRRVDEADGVFVLMCHQQRVGGTDDLPRRVLGPILDAARAEHDADFMTLRTLVEQITTGEQPVAPNPQTCGL